MSAILIEPDPVQMEAPSLPHAEPCVVVIFGATGDLTKRKLMPALFSLMGQGCLEKVHILGVGRNPMSEDEFRTSVRDGFELSEKIEQVDEQKWHAFAERIHYVNGELEDDGTYQMIGTRLEELADNGASRNHLFYLATPPSLFAPIVKGLGKA